MARKYLLTTLGCKVNQYESQQIREVFESLGLRPARPDERPDVALVNTCAVTGNATRKNRQTIRRLARSGSVPIIVVGCGVAADAERLQKLDGVEILLDHSRDVCSELRKAIVHRFPDIGEHDTRSTTTNTPEATPSRPDARRNDILMKPTPAKPGNGASRTTETSKHIMSHDPGNVKKIEDLTSGIGSFAGHQRAFLKVQDGCDGSCTYCIIPQLRPVLRSKPITNTVTEARNLVRAGHKEIVLTGIFLGAYGRETVLRRRRTERDSPLALLIEQLAGIEGLARLRLSSLEPGDVDSTLLNVLATHPNCVPHLHLPLQSGSTTILRRMNRQYTRDAYVAMIDLVRSSLDRPAISTDIIVGFPGETEADFEASLEIARQVEYCKIHAFPFSPRDGTPAARRRKEFVPPQVVRERMHRLGVVETECAISFRRRFIGEVERVIVEDSQNAEAMDSAFSNIRHGRSDRYFEIHFESDTVAPGDLVNIRIDRVTPTRTHGTHLDARAKSYPLHVMTM